MKFMLILMKMNKFININKVENGDILCLINYLYHFKYNWDHHHLMRCYQWMLRHKII
jgi:hypothetical protein